MPTVPPTYREHPPHPLLRGVVACYGSHCASLKAATLLVGPRTTFYGAREAFYVTPSGHILALAEHTPAT